MTNFRIKRILATNTIKFAVGKINFPFNINTALGYNSVEFQEDYELFMKNNLEAIYGQVSYKSKYRNRKNERYLSEMIDFLEEYIRVKICNGYFDQLITFGINLSDKSLEAGVDSNKSIEDIISKNDVAGRIFLTASGELKEYSRAYTVRIEEIFELIKKMILV